MDEVALQDTTKPVPKFTSFRVKEPSPSLGGGLKDYGRNQESTRADGPASKNHHCKEDHGRYPRHDRRSHHDTYEYSVAKGRSRKLRPRPSSPKTILVPWNDGNNTFVIDRNGDSSNLTYGTLDNSSKPSYFRFGAGSVVGLPTSIKIDRYSSSEKVVILSRFPQDASKQRDKASFGKAYYRRSRTLRVRLDEASNIEKDTAADFLPLRLAKRQKRRHRNDEGSSDSLASSDEGIGHYRSVEGKASSSTRPSDEDLSYSSDVSISEQDSRSDALNQDYRQKHTMLSRQVDADSTDPEAWLNFIDHQDRIHASGNDATGSKMTSAERWSNADIKISMYERALEKVISSEARERLLLGMMEEGSKLWDDKKLATKWQSMLRTNPANLGLWTRYLNFKQTNFQSFRYEEVRSVYVESLKVLRSAQVETQVSNADFYSIYEIQIYVVLRMTLFMREAGFLEHATATWQSLIEYICHRPSHFNNHGRTLEGSSESAALLAFEEFWDSEVPRVGEEGAEGWAKFESKRGLPPVPRKCNEKVSIDDRHVFESWVMYERTRSLQSRIPARTSDDLEENDPYRVILFSDIRDALISLPNPNGQHIFVAALLIFCQLPPLRTDSTRDTLNKWWKDPFLRNQAIYQILPSWHSQTFGLGSKAMGTENVPASEEHDAKSIKDPFRFPTMDYQLSSDSLFAAKASWFSPFDAWQNEFSSNQGTLEIGWIRRVFKALVDLGSNVHGLTEYYLAFELRNFPILVERTAKSLLKKQPSQLRLYNFYALVEYRLGNTNSAETVIVTAINMSKKLNEEAQRDTVLLWRTWIWESLSMGHTGHALECLLMFADHNVKLDLSKTESEKQLAVEEVNPALLLRTQSVLRDSRDQMVSLALYSHASMYMECLILLTYLSEHLSISAALTTFKSNLTTLSIHLALNSLINENLYQSMAKLLYHHATNSHFFTPTMIRSFLAESIAIFPQNTIFLSLYAWNEIRFRIDDRVRSLMRNAVFARGSGERQDSVISHFFAIYTELNRGITLGSNSHAVRGTFERAVNSRCGANSAGLWMLYLQFEHSRGEMERAKGIFHRAIRACPWVKGIYMFAFRCLRMATGEHEMRAIYELMGEKELRVHIGLDDVFERIDK